MWKDDTGYHLFEIEDDEQFNDAYIEWVRDKICKHVRMKRDPPDLLQTITARLIEKHPELAPIF